MQKEGTKDLNLFLLITNGILLFSLFLPLFKVGIFGLSQSITGMDFVTNGAIAVFFLLSPIVPIVTEFVPAIKQYQKVAVIAVAVMEVIGLISLYTYAGKDAYGLLKTGIGFWVIMITSIVTVAPMVMKRFNIELPKVK
ncbi:hypothetical protein [Isobaculum melis]|uniref:Uncharacterized protein n=1 Tax=Isobaculum melis TaxID=142588 RepID=A0A1H9RXU2_9LACT|nr:hypothetical protein [Isobaculum melis]SER76709.1 hypothetical protein SAMN04488559_105112 [Isobaculum melis]